MSTHPLRHLIPRATLTLHSKQLQHRLLHPHTLRHASTTPPPKPRVLEKPDKFRPPSHPARLRKPSPYTGPPLSEHQRAQQKTRRYPHMMPPEGSWMHWFLTNRYLHAGITMTVLLALVLSLPLLDFLNTTPYASLLPPNSLFWTHPIAYLSRYAEVYQMHTDYVSAQTAERRRQKVEDVRKRSEFRRAHGMDDGGEGVFGGWTAKRDEEVMGPGMREGGEFSAPSRLPPTRDESAGAPRDQEKVNEDTYTDFDGARQPIGSKKWLGVW